MRLHSDRNSELRTALKVILYIFEHEEITTLKLSKALNFSQKQASRWLNTAEELLALEVIETHSLGVGHGRSPNIFKINKRTIPKLLKRLSRHL